MTFLWKNHEIYINSSLAKIERLSTKYIHGLGSGGTHWTFVGLCGEGFGLLFGFSLSSKTGYPVNGPKEK